MSEHETSPEEAIELERHQQLILRRKRWEQQARVATVVDVEFICDELERLKADEYRVKIVGWFKS